MSDAIKPAVADQIRKLEEAFSADPPQPLQQALARAEGREHPFDAAVRETEALLFAAGEAMSEADIAARLAPATDVAAVLAELERHYAGRGVVLVAAAGRWRFQSAPDLGRLFTKTRAEPKRLSKAGLECLGVIAYHPPVTRAEIEDIRGVSLSRGTLDLLLEIGWVKPRGRRRTPGRPLTYGTTDAFLSHFGLASLDALPGKDDLKAAGLLDVKTPPGFDIPRPGDETGVDEDPLEDGGASPDFYVDHLGAPEE
jgi:segregation and condensation protein B